MPTYRPTNAGHQTKGTLWGGFSPAQLAALTGVFMGAVMLTFVSIIVMKINIWLAVIFIFLLPNTLLLLVILPSSWENRSAICGTGWKAGLSDAPRSNSAKSPSHPH
ncbi:hypothetical protein OH491_27585 (plasmid) [Termitidicoccus mucosus]|uniref:hypothetical protein n=1 Tax=Termitidicoccus mucosus TaxID=1184151 RepID=UPI003182E729